MKINEISSRHTVFTTQFSKWDLHIHLIEASMHNYIIDTGLGSEHMDEVFTYLYSKNNDLPIRIINTHYHFDHVWGNFIFKNCEIISSKECYEQLDSCWESDYETYQEYECGKVEKCLPNHLIDDTLVFDEDGIVIFMTPGHTRGGLSVYDRVEKILNVGDNIGDSIDELIPELDSSLSEYEQCIDKYLDLKFKYCISGHNQIIEYSMMEHLKELIKEDRACN